VASLCGAVTGAAGHAADASRARVRGKQMALQEDLERSGNWLFRRRGYLPVVMICLFLVAMRDYEYPLRSRTFDQIWEIFCLAVSFFGLGIRIFTIGHTPEGTSGRNTETQDAKGLNTTGLYSVMRNPLYLGNFFIYLGISLFAHLWWLTLIFVLAFWLYYERIILAEEAFLRTKFGSQFIEWAEVTPVFIPRFGGYRRPAMSFSFRNVLKREYSGFFAIIVVMFIFETLGELFAGGGLSFDRWWLALLSSGLVVWIVLRTLKRRTSILKVEGR
jgi:protein-S-isoprenylcysteine O-methyltransferase Ste14